MLFSGRVTWILRDLTQGKRQILQCRDPEEISRGCDSLFRITFHICLNPQGLLYVFILLSLYFSKFIPRAYTLMVIGD